MKMLIASLSFLALVGTASAADTRISPRHQAAITDARASTLLPSEPTQVRAPDGKLVGQDPDPNVRLELLRSFQHAE
jgi:hypothetical protein